jgi:hypothetical protein
MKLIDIINILPSNIRKMSPVELVCFVLFIIFIILPVDIPKSIARMVDSSLGMIVVFAVTLYLFFYVNPILGVLYVLVAYELLRRSSVVTGRNAIVMNTPTQAVKDIEMAVMNPPQEKTLEEHMVDIRAPIGKSSVSVIVDSNFKPVADKTLYSGSML